MTDGYFNVRRNSLSVLKKTSVATFPKIALVELTNACNHECIFCTNPIMKRKTENFDIEKYESFIRRASKEGLEEVGLYSTGEPFMTKNLHDYIAVAKNHGLKRVFITTNGALADIEKFIKCFDSGLDSVRFSINAATRESYKKIHGYDDFDKVIKNVEDVYNYIKKKNLKIQLLAGFVYTNITYKEVDIFKEKYSKYFEDVKFIKAHNQMGYLKDRAEKISNKIDETKNLPDQRPGGTINDAGYQPCEMLWNRLHVTAEGNLTACCADYENNLIFSKIDQDKSIYDQFNNEKIQKLRTKHLENKLDGTICKNCVYNTNDPYESISDIPKKENSNDKKIEKINKRLLDF